MRALRIPALSAGWQGSFRALLDQAGSGNAGLVATSPPPAWPGFRRLTVTEIEHECESVISISLADPDGAQLPAAQPGQYLTLRIQPTKKAGTVLRNYSMSGSPDAGYYRISVKREQHGTASGYLHRRLRVGRSTRGRSTSRHLHPRPRRRTSAPDQRRHRCHSGAGHASGACGAPFQAGDLVAPRRTEQPRPLLRRRGARPPRFPLKRTQPRVLQPPRSKGCGRARLRQQGEALGPASCRTGATARCRGLSLRAHGVHGRDQRRPGRNGSGRLLYPHRAVRPRSRPDARHRVKAGAGAPPA